ncbi:Protein FAR1-RELATED SEQUENCE 8 [Bienertia sinuspersici]
MWPDNISAVKKSVCIQHSVDSHNIENNTNVEPCQEESHLDGGISLSNDNDVIPSNNDLRDTATEVIEKGRAAPEVGMTFESFEAVDEFYSAFGKAMGRRKISKKSGCGAGMAAFLNKDGLWQIHKDMHNAVQKDRCKEFDEQDCYSMFQYFAKMKEENEDFFYSWTVDEANKLKDVVWVDARSRAAYRDSGDVVCFDATYTTNRYELPFANFVGVNQHGQSILLGCALIRHEDSETYKWVMRQWLECMGDVRPGGIITDQSTPMANAIQENVGEFQKNMKDVVYDSLTPEEFEGRWIGFTNAKTTLRNFMQKYTRALDHRANVEKVATANDDRRKARVKSTSIVEKHFQKVYTDAKFREVQHECFSLMYFLPKGETHLTEHVTKYTIEDRIQVADPVHHVSKELKVVLDREKGELRYGVLRYEYEKVFQLAASSPELCDHTVSKAHELLQELEELRRGSTSTETRNDGIPSS